MRPIESLTPAEREAVDRAVRLHKYPSLESVPGYPDADQLMILAGLTAGLVREKGEEYFSTNYMRLRDQWEFIEKG